MKHLDEGQLVDAYYRELAPASQQHLNSCPECRASFNQLQETLDAIRQVSEPARAPDYGAQVWTRLLPHLPLSKPRLPWLQWWTLVPSFAALLTIAFMAGRFSERQPNLPPSAISDKARARVLLLSLGDHLERSQFVLSELVNAAPGEIDLTRERDRARELLGANRLLRQTAVRLGDLNDAALLDELERVLLDVANGPDTASPAGLARLQQRIDRGGLLFKVRITSSDSRDKGQKL